MLSQAFHRRESLTPEDGMSDQFPTEIKAAGQTLGSRFQMIDEDGAENEQRGFQSCEIVEALVIAQMICDLRMG